MKSWILYTALLIGWAMATDDIPVESFSPNDHLNWRIVNDGVMGGISQSKMEITEEGFGQFSGNVSLEYNGGFASCRATVAQIDLSGTEGIEIQIKGDGQIYDFRVWVTGRYSRVSYKASFRAEEGEWQTVKLPWNTFRPSFRGRILSDVPPIATGNIREIGFLIAEKQAGPFELKINQISGY